MAALAAPTFSKPFPAALPLLMTLLSLVASIAANANTPTPEPTPSISDLLDTLNARSATTPATATFAGNLSSLFPAFPNGTSPQDTFAAALFGASDPSSPSNPFPTPVLNLSGLPSLPKPKPKSPKPGSSPSNAPRNPVVQALSNSTKEAVQALLGNTGLAGGSSLFAPSPTADSSSTPSPATSGADWNSTAAAAAAAAAGVNLSDALGSTTDAQMLDALQAQSAQQPSAGSASGAATASGSGAAGGGGSGGMQKLINTLGQLVDLRGKWKAQGGVGGGLAQGLQQQIAGGVQGTATGAAAGGGGLGNAAAQAAKALLGRATTPGGSLGTVSAFDGPSAGGGAGGSPDGTGVAGASGGTVQTGTEAALVMLLCMPFQRPVADGLPA